MADEPRPESEKEAGAGLETSPSEVAPGAGPTGLGDGTYEVIRQRLQINGNELRERLRKLDGKRRDVFGSIESKLLQADRIVTHHNCIPRDMIQLGPGKFLFGFNVQFGLKKEIDLSDVFAIYRRDEDLGTFREESLDILQDPSFIKDFKRLYHVYDKARFRKFSYIEGHLYMVFAIGDGVNDISVFKWVYQNETLKFADGRAETDYRRIGFPNAHEFPWKTPDREAFRYGDYPHVSIEDRVFVECLEGALTIKIEDSTASGEGIYEEPVEDRYQKVGDAEYHYAVVGHLIILKIRPYKETAYRYFIFNEKAETVDRVDSIGQSCVYLPEEHGLIFPDGYYLATGELKRFECRERDMILERVVHSPNGEDSLYVFYNRLTGEYALMPYRLILQRVEERIGCHGFSLFPNGHLLLFRADAEPQKHHLIQLRQTPFHLPGFEPQGNKGSFLYQVGNKEIVRCLAEGNEILQLTFRESPYAQLYTDLVRRCEAIVDSYPWLSHHEAEGVQESLIRVREAADQAVDEFDKVRALQREAVQKAQEIRDKVEHHFQDIRRARFSTLEDYVFHLSALRSLRGEIITLRDTRFIDQALLESLEDRVKNETESVSTRCVTFLLLPESLDPYRKQAQEFLAHAEGIGKVAEGKALEKEILSAGNELEMLIEVINGLKIEDATETTRIIDSITEVYSTLNQAKGALKNRVKTLSSREGEAQFNAQMKLLGQSASSYLDLCDRPSKCDEYLNRLSVQLEEMEGVFADYEDYILLLADRRTELYEAFEQKKLALIERRNRSAMTLMTSAERILKVIQNRLAGIPTVEEINTYMASDLMLEKVRETIRKLTELDDTVKADDLQGRLKSIWQEAVRHLKDRQDLFAGGEGLIQLGKHRFFVNSQALDLTLVHKEGTPFIHLTSTQYFEAVGHPEFLATRDVWDQEYVSESQEVYRGEYLAFRMLEMLLKRSHPPSENLQSILEISDEELLAKVREFMGDRYQEGYTKGIHDHDAALILKALVVKYIHLDLARYHPMARGCGFVFWNRFCDEELRQHWTARLKGISGRMKAFPGEANRTQVLGGLELILRGFVEQTSLYPLEVVPEAAAYLFEEIASGDTFVRTEEVDEGLGQFKRQLESGVTRADFEEGRRALKRYPSSEVELIRDWVGGFLGMSEVKPLFQEELVAHLFCGDQVRCRVVRESPFQVLEGLRGQHRCLSEGKYTLNYLDFQTRLKCFIQDRVPRFEQYHALKHQLLEQERQRLRLEEFKPRVLTSFVRNQLIDKVFLPIIGDNLAKQVGVAGEGKRTDLMGLLLLISPPGYGKTTLMEYVANRLGVVFVKINGPALGHQVTSLDPDEAPNAAAGEEIRKLNLALEMGDNIMLYLDDIQHCHPEFLQKFISLCDGQRKIEGVWKGKTRVYDLRGRKVIVVMAGNPYTESGQKFKVPDMLANRADTYNLGDIIGNGEQWFKSSYLENAMTSNPVLAPLANRNQKDVRHFILAAETGLEAVEGLEGSYSSHEMEEVLNILQKLILIREIILKVNLEYIHSAGQADEFRTEPAFKLQGSYRNMNRLAEKVVSAMNDDEVLDLVQDHYRGEAQTLTVGAESNLLKFKELLGVLSEEEKQRWDSIKKTFQRNQRMRGGGENDPMSRVLAQLSGFQSGLEGIQEVLEKKLDRVEDPSRSTPSVVLDFSVLEKSLENLRTSLENRAPSVPLPATSPEPKWEAWMDRMNQTLHGIQEKVMSAFDQVNRNHWSQRLDGLSREFQGMHETLATLRDLSSRQRDYLKRTRDLLQQRSEQGAIEIELTQEMLSNEQAFLDHFHEVLEKARRQRDDGGQPSEPDQEAIKERDSGQHPTEST